VSFSLPRRSLGFALVLIACPVDAQQGRGRVAESAVGEVGQRQTGAQAAPGVRPTARINNRIQNRIQSRISTRIDRNYTPQLSTTSSIEAAAVQTRSTGLPPPR